MVNVVLLVGFVALIVNSKPCEAKTLTESYKEKRGEIVKVVSEIDKDLDKLKCVVFNTKCVKESSDKPYKER